MGCCLTIDKKIPSPPPPPPSSFPKSSRDPPPPLDDEETVKEVLSETPIPKLQDEPKKFPPKQTLHQIQSPDKNYDAVKPNSFNLNPTAEEVSEESSEICTTLSEGVSTTTFNENRDNDVRQSSPAKYRNNRSGSGELRRERAVGKSPSRGSNQSPGRIRSVNGREPHVIAPQWESSVSGPPRSRSPANRTGGGDVSRNGVGRRPSPSVRNTGKSPSRVGSDLNRRGEGGKLVDQDRPTTNESLEDPLVSLECFIFL